MKVKKPKKQVPVIPPLPLATPSAIKTYISRPRSKKFAKTRDVKSIDAVVPSLKKRDYTPPKVCACCVPETVTKILAWRPLQHMRANNPCAVCQGDRPFLEFRNVLINVCVLRMTQFYLAFIFSFYGLGFALNHYARHFPESEVTFLHLIFRTAFFVTSGAEQLMYAYFSIWLCLAVIQRSYLLCLWWFRTSWISVAVATTKCFVFYFLTPEYWYINTLYLLANTALHVYEIWMWQSFRKELMYGEIVNLGTVDLEGRDNRLRKIGAYVEDVRVAQTRSYQDWNTSYSVAENFLRVSNRFNRPKGAELWYNQPTHKEMLKRLKPKRADLVPKPIIPKLPFHRPKRKKPNLTTALGIKEDQFRKAIENYLRQVNVVSTLELREAGRRVYQKHGIKPPGKTRKKYVRPRPAPPVKVAAPAKKDAVKAREEQVQAWLSGAERGEFMEPPGRRPRPAASVASDDGSGSSHRVIYFPPAVEADVRQAVSRHQGLKGSPSFISSGTSIHPPRRGLLRKPGFNRGHKVRPSAGSSDKTVTFGSTNVQDFELSPSERDIKKLANKKRKKKKKRPIFV